MFSVASFDQVANYRRVQDALKRAEEVFGRSHRNWIQYWSFYRPDDVVVKRSFLQELISSDEGAVEVGASGTSMDETQSTAAIPPGLHWVNDPVVQDVKLGMILDYFSLMEVDKLWKDNAF